MAPVHIGVLIVPPIQLLDVAPIDLFAMMTTEYFEACHLPQSLLDTSIPTSDLTITYISADPATLAPTTASLGLGINTGLDDPAVAPGKLDILLIPGPPPGMHIEEPVLDFVRAHVGKGVDLLTICTGIFVAAAAGVLDGKHASGPRGLTDILTKSHPKVKWEDKRWWNDGRVWTSGMLPLSFPFHLSLLRLLVEVCGVNAN
jgi:transcriptional regulator GlxA family with amidase domain